MQGVNKEFLERNIINVCVVYPVAYITHPKPELSMANPKLQHDTSTILRVMEKLNPNILKI
jgi:hypothetical protein